MRAASRAKQFPDFFTTRGPISTNVTPLRFGNDTYWMCTVGAEEEPVENPKRSQLKPYQDNDEGLLECGDIEENYDIVLTKSGKFMTSFYVPSSLLSYIIGTKASKLKNLQRTTNTLIKVPKLNEKGDVKITGDTERKVASARTQISIIVTQRKEKLPVSHFVSIPINSESVMSALTRFQEAVLHDAPRGVTPLVFQKLEKLHLTICVLTLVDDEEISIAKKVLKNCYEQVISKLFPKGGRYRLVIKGLEIMNDDPSEVDVLYGKVEMVNRDDNEKLQEMADMISEYYYKAGLAKRQYDKVKLHVTLMNSRFKNDERRQSFDATSILEKYRNYEFGTVALDNLQLSVRFTGNNSYYDSALKINM